MPALVGKRLQFLRLLFSVARKMRDEGWGDKPFSEAIAELMRRLAEEGQKVGFDLDELIKIIEELLPLILAILEIILGLFAEPRE